MNPLFLVNWHRLHVRFRTSMWLVAIVLAVVVLVAAAHASTAARAKTGHGANPHVVVGTIRPA